MTKSDFPTDPNAETIGLPSDDSGKGSEAGPEGLPELEGDVHAHGPVVLVVVKIRTS